MRASVLLAMLLCFLPFLCVCHLTIMKAYLLTNLLISAVLWFVSFIISPFSMSTNKPKKTLSFINYVDWLSLG